MATHKVLKSTASKPIRIYFNGRNISGASNSVSLDGNIAEVESTDFTSLAKDAEAGLETVKGTAAIMFPEDFDIEGVLFDARGVTSLLSFFHDGITVGTSVEFSVYGPSLKHDPGGQVGALVGSTLDISGKGVPMLRGVVLENEGTTYDESSTAGEDIEITGGVSATQRLYLILHVLEFTDLDSVDISLESDADNTFASATERIAATTFTDSGSALLSVDGAITDDNFRLVLAPAGTGTFKLAAALALVAVS